jgi:hypothetical protein
MKEIHCIIIYGVVLYSFSLGRAPTLRSGSVHSGLRFARCFARFAPTCGSRKNLATKAQKKPSGKVLRAFFWGWRFYWWCFAVNENLDFISCFYFFVSLAFNSTKLICFILLVTEPVAICFFISVFSQ